MASAAAVKEALHVKAQRGGPQALREREVIEVSSTTGNRKPNTNQPTTRAFPSRTS